MTCEEKTAALMESLKNLESMCRALRSGANLRVTQELEGSNGGGGGDDANLRVSPRGKRGPIEAGTVGKRTTTTMTTPSLSSSPNTSPRGKRRGDATTTTLSSSPQPQPQQQPQRHNFYNDNLASEVEKLSRLIDEMRQSLDKLEGTINTVRWAKDAFVVAVRAHAPVHWAYDRVLNPDVAAALDEDMQFWLQQSGYLARYQRCFIDAGIHWSEAKNVTELKLRDAGVGAADAKRIVKSLVREDLYEGWEHVICAGWLKKRGKHNKSWRARYCVLLTNQEMLYYKSEYGERPQDSVLLRKVEMVSSDAEALQIQLHTLTRTYELEAPSKIQWIGWLRLFSILVK